MSRVDFGGMGPDSATAVAVVEIGGSWAVGIQLLGARFSMDATLARELAQWLVAAADALEEPGGLYGLPVIPADTADHNAINRAITSTARRQS